MAPLEHVHATWDTAPAALIGLGADGDAAIAFGLAMAAGLVAGVLHVVTGPDHVAAVLPLAASQRERAWRAGLTWGGGHATGAVIAAVVALAVRGPFVELWNRHAAWLVGVTLVLVGALGMARAFRLRPHGSLVDDGTHTHSRRATFAVGLFQGAFGLSHVVLVLPALMLPTGGLALAYVAAYAGGAMTGMVAITHFLGAVVRRWVSSPRRLAHVLGAVSAGACLCGITWLAA